MRLFFSLMILIGLILIIALPAQAADFNASTAQELIDAINAANSNTEIDTIILTTDITLTVVDNNADFIINTGNAGTDGFTDGANGLPLITSEITIDGNNFTIARDGGASAFRLFAVAGSGTLTLNNVTLSNGSAQNNSVSFLDDTAGGIINIGTLAINNSTITNNSTLSAGGGISNLGTLTVNNSTITNNTVFSGAGGGIFNFSSSTLTINNSAITNNSAQFDGGGIYNFSIVTINNSTISKNTSTFSAGGGIFSDSGTVIVNNSTFSENSAFGFGGGILNATLSTITLSNSIIANSLSGDDFSGFGTTNLLGNNIVEDGTLVGVNVSNVDPLLDSLADNGAPTQTNALGVGSPAIDASGAGATTSDQRGVSVQNGTRDIGAYESGANPTYPTVVFSTTSVNHNENAGTVNIGLSISGAVNFAGIAEVYIGDALTGSATSGADYTAFDSQIVTIDCSSGTCPTNATVSLALLTDAVLENNETVNLQILGTNGFATVGAQSTFIATIQDITISTATITANDPTSAENPVDNGQFTVDLNALNGSGSAINVNYTVSGSASSGVDYTALSGSVSIPDGSQTATIDVIPLNDNITDDAETVIVTLSSTNNANVSVNTTPAQVTISDLTATIVEVVTPQIDVFDPAISKIGFLVPGQVGVTGEQLEWVVTVSNTGTIVGNNVAVTDTLIDALQVTSVNAPSGIVDINGQVVTVTYPTINVGETFQFSIFTTVLDGVEVNNTVCINADNQSAEECVSATPITALPLTGESPFWRNPLLVVGLILASAVSLFIVKQRKNIS